MTDKCLIVYVFDTCLLLSPWLGNIHTVVTRQHEWDNIITCHQNCYYAYSWRKETFSLGKHKMRSMDPVRSLVTVCSFFISWQLNTCFDIIFESYMITIEVVQSWTIVFLQSVCLSACGNFALIGSQSGWIDKYNIQSGFHRGCYPPLPSNFFTNKRARRTYGKNTIIDITHTYRVENTKNRSKNSSNLKLRWMTKNKL